MLLNAVALCSIGLVWSQSDAPGRTTPERPIDASALEILLPTDPAVRGPLTWAQGAVWYQIFPERFRNANPLNDPSDASIYLKRWTSDWYAVDPLEKAFWLSKQSKPSARPGIPKAGGAIYDWIFDRRYGGDLQGVVEKLDHITSLGVTALYLNPIFQAQSLHKYDASDFRHIDINLAWPSEAGRPMAQWEHIASETDDPATWTWTPADRYFIDVFLPGCKKRGLRVILDGVWNHCGRGHWAFADVVANGSASRYADWFYTKFDRDGKLIAWQAWDGPSGWLPKFKQTDAGDLHPPIKKHIFDVTRRWMDPNNDGDPSDGIDGWRLDVVPDVPAPFWKDWRAHVKSINPGAITIAEIWQKKDQWPQGAHFDTQMNYPFAVPVLEWLSAGVPAPEKPAPPAQHLDKPARKQVTTSAELIAALEQAFAGLSEHDMLIAQNLYASHDTDRYVSMLYNPGREYDKDNSAMNASPGYRNSRPTAEIYDLSVLGVAIQTAYLGAPMIYNGDELGVWGADDPDDRKPVPWPDLPPNDNPADRGDPTLVERYAKWLRLRSDGPAANVLRFGSLKHLDSGSPDVFAFVREFDGTNLLFVANRGSGVFNAATLLEQAGFSGVSGGVEVPARDARFWAGKLAR